MLRTFQLADFITLLNAAAGTACILCLMSYLVEPEGWRVWVAMAFLPAALFFDVMDGTVARWRKRQSILGRELDSLADIVSFGVAPAAVAFTLGMRGLWDALILMFFVGCGISRLARFNVTAEALSQGGDKVKYFEGTPIPTSLSLVGLLAGLHFLGFTGNNLLLGEVLVGPFQWHPLSIIYVISGSAMISKTLRIPKP
jgi:CDP-diacylglycerol--serine O-phosphatidyltransferase